MTEPSPSSPALTPDHQRAFLETLFSSMAANKALPKYQFERRIDALLAVLLPDLLGQLLSTEVTFVVPEFPLKKGTSNQSTNIDHVYFDKRGRWIFVEIKTDARSVSQKQIDIYVEAKSKGMEVLVDQIHKIRAATKQRSKYDTLLERLGGYPVDAPIDLLYLAPSATALSTSNTMRVITFQELATLRHRVFSKVWDLACSTLIDVIQ